MNRRERNPLYTMCSVCGACIALLCSVTAGAQEAEGQDADQNAYAAARTRMVEEDIQHARLGRKPVTDEAVLAAMRTVPRHEFVPDRLAKQAYADRSLPIGHGQTISQPYIVAYMTQALEVKADDTVLEVGTGSGYQAAVLAEIVETVYTIEIIPPLAEQGQKQLADAGYENVHTRTGDGYFGWEEAAPFDAIIVTAAASHIPPPLVEQLKPGGRMVIPVGPPFRVQNLMIVEKREDGSTVQHSIMPVRFVPLTRSEAEESGGE
ncbi:MAG: protein-L-isoaspartate(D-aspartate) O-methyltransferase [Candidatus Hydrogenedentota bacterium]